MEYIVCKKYNKKGIEKIFNLKVGTILNTFDNVIYLDKSPICYIGSQDAFDYFARNDDELGTKRFELSHKIIDKIIELVKWYENAINEVRDTFTEETTEEEKLKALAKVEDKVSLSYNIIHRVSPSFLRENTSILSASFYNAKVEDLETILKALESL